MSSDHPETVPTASKRQRKDDDKTNPPQDREVESTVKYLQQVRGGPDEIPRHGEVMARTLVWECKTRDTGAVLVQKILIPDWAKSYKITLELSSEAQK